MDHTPLMHYNFDSVMQTDTLKQRREYGGGLERMALGFSRGAAWVYEMWRELSEMVHRTGLEMDGWGRSNLWRMNRPVGEVVGSIWLGVLGRAGLNHAGPQM